MQLLASLHPQPSLPKPRSRIEKIVAWATKRGLFRPLCLQYACSTQVQCIHMFVLCDSWLFFSCPFLLCLYRSYEIQSQQNVFPFLHAFLNDREGPARMGHPESRSRPEAIWPYPGQGLYHCIIFVRSILLEGIIRVSRRDSAFCKSGELSLPMH